MNHLYLTAVGFAHAVRYRDLMIRAWCKRTGRMDKRGAYSYLPADCPYDIPTNDERGRAELILFRLKPLQHGEVYTAYLTAPKPEHTASGPIVPRDGRGVITTWNGELLAVVTKITSYRAVCFGRDAGDKGSFWAMGVDGRTYYGRHNGRGMYCRMRLAKWVDEFNIQQRTCAGWETVNCEPTRALARASLTEYHANAPGSYRIKRERVRQQ